MPVRHLFFFVLFVSVGITLETVAQTAKYFIEFTDKQNSPYSVDRPSEFLSPRAVERRIRQKIALSARDLPVNPAYVAAVRQAGAKVWYASRWMNGALIEADQATIGQLDELPFIKSFSDRTRVNSQMRNGAGSGIKSLRRKQTEAIDYGNSRNQNAMLEIDQMHAAGFTGKDIHIAIMDGGFFAANEMPVFRTIFDDQRVLGTYDFVRNQPNVYDKSQHGTQVWSVLAGYSPGALVGPAYGASFWLLRTEEEVSEYRVEEVNWLMAAEFADSAGVDIIQSSLGYTTFDDPSMDYSPQQMDGKTAFITRAARLAAATGMLVVASAGNEGNDSWRTLSAPADADSVLAVAAVDRLQLRASLSSFGKIVGQKTIKPNVAAQGTGTVVMSSSNSLTTANGTSFSSPLIAGLAAGLWQAFPQLTNMQLLRYLQQAGSQATRPDTLLGYGIPHFTRAFQLIQKDADPNGRLGSLSPNPLASNELVFRANLSQLQQPITLEFFDLQGRPLLLHVIVQPQAENIVNLPSGMFFPGIYIVRASNSTRQTVLRLVKL